MKKFLLIIAALSVAVLTALQFLTQPRAAIQLAHYYDYDRTFPLHVQERKIAEGLYHVTFNSVHQVRVPALLRLPLHATPPYPAVIMLHGIGDHKDKPYMAIGDSILAAAGFAVLRPDFALHGERVQEPLDHKTLRKHLYTVRDAIAQTVFDLRRAVDYLDSRADIDSTRTAFIGISLGGITGTVFCAVEERIELPILALAGGGLRWALGKDAFSEKLLDMIAPIEPLNFAQRLESRPVLFLNAERDEVIPKLASVMLQQAVPGEKEVIWYDAGHQISADRAFADCRDWLLARMGSLDSAAPGRFVETSE